MPEEIQEELYRRGFPCFMLVKASTSVTVLPDGSSNSALGLMWCKREQLRPAAMDEDERVSVDVELDFGLPKCTICEIECGADELSMHERCCRQLQELKQQMGQPPPPPKGHGHPDVWGAVRLRFFHKWSLWQRGHGSTMSAGAKRKYDAALAHARLAVFAKYRQRLLEGYDKGERERPAHKLLCEASHVYQAAYSHCPQGQNKQILELAWQIAGYYLLPCGNFRRARS